MRLIDPEREAFSVLSERLAPSGPAPLSIALSGGGDSVALLLMATAWARRHGRRVVAFTVDHQLHPESGRWTAAAGVAAVQAGAQWRSLAWEGEKPAAGLPAAARAARHRLIAEAARAEGAAVILIGHTADGVLEAGVMRAEGSTTPDPKIWSPSPAWPEGRGLFLLRPLLSVRRQALRDWLDRQGAAWIEDPGNADPRFARSRARSRLTSDHIGDMPTPAVEPGEPIQSSSTPDGRLMVERADVGEGSHRFMAMALVCAAGGATPPRRPALNRLLARLASGEDFTAALGGARIEADGRHVTFGREPGERTRGGLAATPVSPRAPTVWDGRFAIEAEVEGAIAPLAGRMASLPRAERQALRSLPASARGAIPVFVDGAGEARLPRPFGSAHARAVSLVGARLAGACGRIQREGDIQARLSDNGAEGLGLLSWGSGLSDAGICTGGEGRM